VVHAGPHTDKKVEIVAGDFWLNVYSDALSVGSGLLAGNGIAKFTAIRALEAKLRDQGKVYDYVMIDLPPSFGGLVRSSLHSSDYLIIPCTSDTFSEYCIGLISKMLPQFVSDWRTGLERFKQNNYGSKEYDNLGKPKYAGWIFNGYDTRSKKMLRADAAHYENINGANEKLAQNLRKTIKDYDPICANVSKATNIGKVEDMNVLMQNSLWQNVPASKLDSYLQVKNLSGDKSKWSKAQLELIEKLQVQIKSIAKSIVEKL
jgi:chromosome partitioning protein